MATAINKLFSSHNCTNRFFQTIKIVGKRPVNATSSAANARNIYHTSHFACVLSAFFDFWVLSSTGMPGAPPGIRLLRPPQRSLGTLGYPKRCHGPPPRDPWGVFCYTQGIPGGHRGSQGSPVIIIHPRVPWGDHHTPQGSYTPGVPGVLYINIDHIYIKYIKCKYIIENID